MAYVNPRPLLSKLNPFCDRAFKGAIELCVSRTNREVEIEHWLFRLIEEASSDLTRIFRQYDIDKARILAELTGALDQLPRGSNRTDAKFTPELFDLIREAWVLGSLEYQAPRVRSSFLLAILLTDRTFQRVQLSSTELARIPGERLLKELKAIVAGSPEEEAPAAPGQAPPGHGQVGTKALDQYTTNLTERAAKGEIDPVIGRDGEIRQVIDILQRRRQNNPILTGEAGVGKTAVVEGFALRVTQGDVPPSLKGVQVRTLDLGLLQAGAGVKGEFENRLKSVIQEVKASPQPIILFIDEAHTMIGAGGQAGQSDAANLLKPALARGELRTIAATTWDEYKKYFETDAALQRRFQVIKVEEPDDAKAMRMLRGLSKRMEGHHKVRLLEEAIEDAVKLSVRYVTERQLPDKAVSLLDTACARVALSQSATPANLEDCRREIELLALEIEILQRESKTGIDHSVRLAELSEEKKAAEERKTQLEAQWEKETKLVEQLVKHLAVLENEKTPEADKNRAMAEWNRLRLELTEVQGRTPLVYPVVDRQAVAEVVSGWTGIPVGKMVLDEIRTVLDLKSRMEERIIGQPQALEVIARRIQTARANLVDPRRPIGVFLLVGPSGVGKTETALALADILYGGDRNVVVINMSEYKDKMNVPRLTGSAPGLVGYGEGGVLTESVRRRPYSIVLLDEIEKADRAVHDIFYQVFDKGMLQDDRQNEINFKNTIILLTSNVGTEKIMKLCADPDTCPPSDKLAEQLREDLLQVFKPALLGRLNVVPYFPLGDEVIRKIVQLQLRRIGDRLQANQRVRFEYDSTVVETVAKRCTEVESGARNVDHILTGTLLPEISKRVLLAMADGKTLTQVQVGVTPEGEFTYLVE